MRTLTWKINGKLPEGVDRANVQRTLQCACDGWQKAAAGELRLAREASQLHPADIHFEFGRTGVAERLPGLHRTMQRQGGGIRHIITFHEALPWNTGGFWNRIFGNGWDLRTVALFHIGVVLGLDNNDREKSAMSSIACRAFLRDRPDREDAQELRTLLLRSEKQSWRD